MFDVKNDSRDYHGALGNASVGREQAAVEVEPTIDRPHAPSIAHVLSLGGAPHFSRMTSLFQWQWVDTRGGDRSAIRSSISGCCILDFFLEAIRETFRDTNTS